MLMLDLGDGRRLAYMHTPGTLPGVVFFGGFMSDMTGSKALALEQSCVDEGRAFTRFDYTGHGASTGEFEAGTIGAWLDDGLAIIDRVTTGPLALVGSSMGGWIIVLAALARRERVKGLVGIASAPDFTEELMWKSATAKEKETLLQTGRWLQPSAYSEEPYVITKRLIEEGRAHLLLNAPIDFIGPVHLLHGQRDPDVPWETSLRLAAQLTSDDVTVELIKAGDHRLSTVSDIERIAAAVTRILGRIGENSLSDTGAALMTPSSR